MGFSVTFWSVVFDILSVLTDDRLLFWPLEVYVLWEDIFELNASAAASKFCE